MNTNVNVGLALLRLVVAGTMIFYGINKILYGIGWMKDILASAGLPSLIAYGVYIGEIIVPLMLLIGVRTKIAGVILVVNCLFAILLVHLPDVLSLNTFGGWKIDLLIIYTLLGLALFFTGAGKYALSTNNKWD